jgi:hypothetical protein
MAAMQANTSDLRGDPAIGNLEQGGTSLSHVGQSIMIAVLDEFRTLLGREV